MSTKKSFRLFAVLIASLWLASAASAGIIVLRPGDPTGTPYALGDATPDEGLNQMLAVSWSQTFSTVGAAINVYNLQNFDTEQISVQFALIPDDLANPASYTASADLPISGTPVGDTLLVFPGSVDLSAGTWFLVASATGYQGAWLSGIATIPPAFAAPGAALLSDYYQSAGTEGWESTDVALGFQVSEAVPEPGSWMLMGAGLAALVGLARRRRA